MATKKTAKTEDNPVVLPEGWIRNQRDDGTWQADKWFDHGQVTVTGDTEQDVAKAAKTAEA